MTGNRDEKKKRFESTSIKFPQIRHYSPKSANPINQLPGVMKLLMSDVMMSFMWVWSSVVIKIFVYKVLEFSHHDVSGEVLRLSLSVINMFLFAYLGKFTNGGAYNPLTVLNSAMSGNFTKFVFTLASRIPCQVFGSILAVKLILKAFPEIGRGPRLTISLHQGALTEGLLTFAIVLIGHGLSTKIPGSFFRKTWISSVSKLALHILGSDITGGCMNPASVMGWAYARGDHITKEHLFVYWLAPMEATLLAAWTFKYLVRPSKLEKEKKTN